MHSVVKKVTERIIARSREMRLAYLQQIAETRASRPFRHRLPCSNLAHDLAGASRAEKNGLLEQDRPNIAIISGYNDLLSAHQPYGDYPPVLKDAVAKAGGSCQFAAGVPAMCDGVTQGEPGMDLSLVSRDVIAMSTVIGLSHNVFDGALLLGICDKILPGLLMGGLQFGHLPMLLVPGGPMKSGLANKEKARARERYALGEINHAEMLDFECRAYHSPGTCTFYGTANSNQLMAEMLGMHLPGASFVNSGTAIREQLTRAAAARVTAITAQTNEYLPIGHVISEKSVVNAIIGLMASGGSTNETIHLVAIARAAGIVINWDDFTDLSDVTPLLVRIYPNGSGDINSFQEAGGMAVLIKELLENGFLHEDVQTVAGRGLERYTATPEIRAEKLVWGNKPAGSQNTEIITTVKTPFAASGGLKVLSGNLGRAIIKVSSLAQGRETRLTAPAMIFHTQEEMGEAFKAGEMDHDLVAVVRFQGPRANGMPELHKLITYLSIIMDRGYTVGLVTDGRLSGASGKVPFAIHLTPEGLNGGMIAKVREGDLISLDAKSGELHLHVDDAELEAREYAKAEHLSALRQGTGRQIFASLRRNLPGAEEGASSIFASEQENISPQPVS
ncbi:MAG: phosphogluconate dehydratase [Proteobacteria bacterium]|nr:phosphogluconate dehydratase [Pseudomonadota bacterium]MBU1058543.1 phosphogluconate dehydratase [Pseudomonadota bacterium]